MSSETTISFNELLLQRLHAGEQLAYRQLYELSWQSLLNGAYKRLGVLPEAEEVVQDVFTSLFQRRDTLSIEPAKLMAYLHQAVEWRCYDVYRKWMAQKQLHLIPGLEDVDYAVPANYLAEAKELAAEIENVIAGLPQRCQQVFRMSRFEQLTNKEIAAQLGISVGVVEKMITRALRELRAKFGDYELLLIGCYVLYHYYS